MNLELLRRKRDELHMPQFEAAARIGAAYRTFVRWESGDSEPRVSEFVAWCRVLGIEPADALEAPKSEALPR